MEPHNSTSDHRYDYSHLQQRREDEEHFYLTLDRRVWHILNESQFTKGNPAQFAAFLAGKTGKPAGWVNDRTEAERKGAAE